MKKIFTLLLALMISGSFVFGQGLFMSEVADPGDDYNGRFIELYNAGTEAVDFSVTTMYLSRQSNGGTTWGDVQLVGTVAAGETFVIGTSFFQTLYGFAPDQEVSVLSGNGDDAYFLFQDGDHTAGTLYDIYGAIDTDGTGEGWEYLDSRAYRVGGITSPNTTWTASEWEIASADIADFDPGTHDASVVEDLDAPVWEAGYPMTDNVEDVQFDLMAQLDETSTVYYVVLDDGATAPTVEEVKAGTGSAAVAAVASGSFTAGTSATTETVTGLTVEMSYDVYVVAEDDEDTPNVQADVSLLKITTVIMPDVLYLADFDSDLSPFIEFSESGDTRIWGQTGGFAEINGYGSSELEVDWLISPEFVLTGITSPEIVFDAAWKYGIEDDTHFFKLMYSEDYDGDTLNLATSTWTELAFTPGESDTWTEIGPLDISFVVDTVYFAFVANYPDNYRRWRIDNAQILGFAPAGTDATLSDLQVDGVTIEGFDSPKQMYTYELPAGTTTVPTVTFTTSDESATTSMTVAPDLTGDAAARTTTVTVTAQDGTTIMEYAIVFNPILEVANIGALRAINDESRKYILSGEVLLTFQQSYRNKKYVQDATGGMEIDDSPGAITSVYAIGDGITGLEGTIEDYSGLLQFHPTSDPGAASSTGNELVPAVATPAQINANIDMYEGMLVTVEGATIDEADGTTEFANGDNLTLNGATESMVLRVHFYGTSLTGSIIPDSADVTGIVLEYNGTAQISPRSSDDVVELIMYVPSDDATLSDLTVDGATVTGFSPALLSYYVTLAQGTTAIPAVVGVSTDDNATVVVTDATDLAGDAPARTTTVTVTAEDGVSVKTYTIEFTVDVSARDDVFSAVNIYPVPAVNQLNIDNAQQINTVTLYNITGAAVLQVSNEGNSMISIDIASLGSGVYMIQMENDKASSVKRFVKQ